MAVTSNRRIAQGDGNRFAQSVISDEEAQRLGMVNSVVDANALQEKTDERVSQLLAQPRVAFAHMKRLFRSSANRDLRAQLSAERDACQECAATDYFRNAVAKFFKARA